MFSQQRNHETILTRKLYLNTSTKPIKVGHFYIRKLSQCAIIQMYLGSIYTYKQVYLNSYFLSFQQTARIFHVSIISIIFSTEFSPIFNQLFCLYTDTVKEKSKFHLTFYLYLVIASHKCQTCHQMTFLLPCQVIFFWGGGPNIRHQRWPLSKVFKDILQEKFPFMPQFNIL